MVGAACRLIHTSNKAVSVNWQARQLIDSAGLNSIFSVNMEPLCGLSPLNRLYRLFHALMFILEPVLSSHIPGIHSAFNEVAQEKLFFAASEATPIDEFAQWMERNLQANCPQFVA